MGSNNSKEQFQTIDRGTLNEYRELTPFSKAEILSFHADFHKLNPNKPRRPDPRFKVRLFIQGLIRRFVYFEFRLQQNK